MNFKKQFFQDNQKSNKSKFNFLQKKETTIARDLFVLGLSRISQQVKLA